MNCTLKQLRPFQAAPHFTQRVSPQPPDTRKPKLGTTPSVPGPSPTQWGRGQLPAHRAGPHRPTRHTGEADQLRPWDCERATCPLHNRVLGNSPRDKDMQPHSGETCPLFYRCRFGMCVTGWTIFL